MIKNILEEQQIAEESKATSFQDLNRIFKKIHTDLQENVDIFERFSLPGKKNHTVIKLIGF